MERCCIAGVEAVGTSAGITSWGRVVPRHRFMGSSGESNDECAANVRFMDAAGRFIARQRTRNWARWTPLRRSGLTLGPENAFLCTLQKKAHNV
jgi:hypothetical protein